MNSIVHSFIESYIKDNADEIIDILKKHLSICVYTNHKGTKLFAEVYFDGEEICSSSTDAGKQSHDDD